MRDLLEYLNSLQAGPVPDPAELTHLLAACWEDFTGSDAEGMEAGKLDGRIEHVAWTPPELSFTIERHGGTVLGSRRAERHRWTLDVDTRTASCERIGHQQLSPMAPQLDVRPLAKQIARLILERRLDERVQWNSDGSVRLCIGMIIPDSGPKQTVEGRRRRFRKALDNELAGSGWRPVRPNVYQAPRSTATHDRGGVE